MAQEFPRDLLEVNRLYCCPPMGQWFYTPDGVGIVWYDTVLEAMDDTDAFGQPIIVLDRALADY